MNALNFGVVFKNHFPIIWLMVLSDKFIPVVTARFTVLSVIYSVCIIVSFYIPVYIYVAAKATYIRLLHGKIGIFFGFFGPSSAHMGRTHIVLG